MERRKALKNLGISMGGLVVSPTIISLLQSCNSSYEPWSPVFFAEDQGRFMMRLVDNILPASGKLPSATEVNVHKFIDKFIKEVISVDDKPNMRESIAVTLQALLSIAGEEGIDEVGDEHYVDMLSKHLQKTKEEETELWTGIQGHMAENNNSVRGMATDLIVFQFLYQIRAMAIFAYKTNEMVGENILAYKPIPGEQKGCVDLQTTTGGKAWALYW